VYTALLTQSGGDDPLSINTGVLTIGVTYMIYDNSPGMDFTNVGAPNNNLGTYFVATGLNPNNWGEYEGTGTATLVYNSGAPVVTVLENTIGNIWFSYTGTGTYDINSDAIFTENKTGLLIAPQTTNSPDTYVFQFNRGGDKELQLQVLNADESGLVDDILFNQMIEIRVYN
jgi:hypothetical protein